MSVYKYNRIDQVDVQIEFNSLVTCKTQLMILYILRLLTKDVQIYYVK